MKHINITEFVGQEEITITSVMSRRQKLERWADLISKHENDVTLVDRLEDWDDEELNRPLAEMQWNRLCGRRYESEYYKDTAFQIAADDPMFREAGLIDTVASAMNFFDLTQSELHEFTCNCGGQISNSKMARRIRNFANPTWSGWIANWFR